jgi:hypothetical protein
MLYSKEDLEPLMTCPKCGSTKHIRYDFCGTCEAFEVEARMKMEIAGYYRRGNKWVSQ